MRIDELRRRPEASTRLTAFQFLEQYKDDPNAYLHTTDVEKVGIHPRTGGHDAPMGIYAFRLQDIWHHIEFGNQHGWDVAKSLPYYGGPNFFILKADIPIDFVEDYNEEDLKRDIMKLKQLFKLDDNEAKRLLRAAKTNPNFVDNPAGYLWGMTKAIAAGGISEFDQYTPTNEKRWALILRKLGYSAFNDPGYGFIHGAEGSQALFLDKSAFEVVDYYKLHRKKQIQIGDKVFQSAPRKIYMKGIPNVFFYNNEPEDFRNVREWVVESMDIGDLSKFLKFLPWNAQGRIGTVGVKASTTWVQGYIRDLVNAAPRVTIDSLIVTAGDDWYSVPIFLAKLPPNIPVNTILYPQNVELGERSLEKIHPQIQAKLKQLRWF